MGRLLDEDAVIKVLERWQKAFRENSHYVSASDLSLVVKDVRELPHAQPEPHWIPVTENTLPDKNRVVVVCGNKGTWDYGMYRGYCNSNVHLWEWKKKTLKWVYWWMYKEDALTEPYREEKEK